MTRVSHGLPGIYNASPLTLGDGDGAALAVNSSGQLIAVGPSGADANQVQGNVGHDAVDAGGPLKIGGYASAAAPTSVSADGDRVNAWYLRNGAQANVLTAAGALIGGDAANGLDVDVTRVSGTVATSSLQLPTALSADRIKVAIVTGAGGDNSGDANGLKVESRFSIGRVTADGQIKGSAGFVHTVSIAPITATPTAGLVTIYDSTTESGTILYSEWVFATTPGHTILLDEIVGTGIYVGFDASLANVQVSVSYR